MYTPLRKKHLFTHGQLDNYKKQAQMEVTTDTYAMSRISMPFKLFLKTQKKIFELLKFHFLKKIYAKNPDPAYE